MEKTATISECGLYRYDLTRRWADGGTTCAFIGLNPSTADEELDDPTIRRCIGFAKSWGHNRLVMLNAYAFRATNPKNMKAADDPIGSLNDEYLFFWLLNHCKVAVAAWGVNIDPVRQKWLLEKFSSLNILKLTKDGFPSHPLYLSKNLLPRPWLHNLLDMV